ncbi:MAG: transposase [Myxococcales bacterium]|nr:transposase [Myxococcales bacterium]
MIAVQRTSSDLKLNPHVHAVFLDGAYRDKGEELRLSRGRAPVDAGRGGGAGAYARPDGEVPSSSGPSPRGRRRGGRGRRSGRARRVRRIGHDAARR